VSGVFGANASAAFARASERARAVLKPGDRVTLSSSCGSGVTTVTFANWGHVGHPVPGHAYFAGRTVDDLHPWNITKVNGQPVSFRDDRGQREVSSNQAQFRAERVQRRRRAMRIIPTTIGQQDGGK